MKFTVLDGTKQTKLASASVRASLDNLKILQQAACDDRSELRPGGIRMAVLASLALWTVLSLLVELIRRR